MDTMHSLVEQYLPLANKLAYDKKKTLPRYVDFEELQSAAYLGLVEAASRFDAMRGNSFMTYAYPRILGAIQDHLRSIGRLPSISLEAKGDEEFALKDTISAKESSDIDEVLEVVSSDLGEQAQNVLRLYFVEDYSMKEVGQQFGVSESRISQLLTSYKNGIRHRWNESDLREELAA